MDSLPQELIDSIIDNVPGSSLLSCSLIARRWRRKSQQRVLDVIAFSSEDEVNRWWTDIPQDPGGITSYVRSVQFVEIPYWDEPTLFGRVLKNLTSVRELTISETEVPDELLDHISHGEFGKEITTLYFWFPRCTLATMASMILSLPNLKELGVDDGGVTSEEPLPIHSVTSRRKRLDSLQLYGNVNGIGEILAKSRFIASRLCLDLHIPGAPQLLMLSSEMVVELNLCGAWFFQSPQINRNESERCPRYPGRGGPSSRSSTIVTYPYYSCYRPLYGCPLSSPYKHPMFHWFGSSVNICRCWVRFLGFRRNPPGRSVG